MFDEELYPDTSHSDMMEELQKIRNNKIKEQDEQE